MCQQRVAPVDGVRPAQGEDRPAHRVMGYARARSDSGWSRPGVGRGEARGWHWQGVEEALGRGVEDARAPHLVRLHYDRKSPIASKNGSRYHESWARVPAILVRVREAAYAFKQTQCPRRTPRQAPWSPTSFCCGTQARSVAPRSRRAATRSSMRCTATEHYPFSGLVSPDVTLRVAYMEMK